MLEAEQWSWALDSECKTRGLLQSVPMCRGKTREKTVLILVDLVFCLERHEVREAVDSGREG